MTEITGTSVVYLDTNILIYFIEGRSHFHARARRAIESATERGATLVTSELTFAECIYRPYRDHDRYHARLYETAFTSDLLKLYPLSGDLVIRAAKDGGSLGLKLIDAVHYISALEAGCDLLLTADRKFRTTENLEVVGL